MLGGKHYKIIREWNGDCPLEGVVAYEAGCDLCVTSKVFDTFMDLVDQAKPDLPDPKWDENELAVLGKMLTATTGKDTARLASIVSRLMTLYAKFVCDDKTCSICGAEDNENCLNIPHGHYPTPPTHETKEAT